MFDGMRMAGIDNPEDFLNAAKLERVERELTGIIRKTYDALPMGEPWSPSQVLAEMARQTGSRPEHRAVTACIGQLVERGLAKEPARGMFLRVPVKPQLVAVAPDAAVDSPPAREAEMTQMTPPKPAEPMDRLASLASTLKSLGEKVAATAKEVEDVAIDVEERIQRIHADTEKLRQLQALLKSIGQ